MLIAVKPWYVLVIRISSSRYKTSNLPKVSDNGPSSSTGIIANNAAGPPFELSSVSPTLSAAPVNSNPTSFRSTVAGLRLTAKPLQHTFCKTLSPSLPLKGRDDAQSGLFHSMTFLMYGGEHSCPILPSLEGPTAKISQICINETRLHSEIYKATNKNLLNGPPSRDVISGASV
jgi:hypothetical protein